MPRQLSHVFICFSSSDEAIALDVVRNLEAGGLACWISSRDVLAGQNYQESIVDAIEAADGVVFLFSTFSNASGEIKKELSLAGSLDKPVFPLRLEPVAPTGALRYELATRQWIDIFPDREAALCKLVKTVDGLLNGASAVESDGVAASPNATPVNPASSAKAYPALEQASSVAGSPIVAPNTEHFETIRTLLAQYIGPIAKVLINKAASEALTIEDLFERLAAHVPAPSDRATFLRTVRTKIPIKP